MRNAIKELSPQERNILRMHYIDNVSFEDLGDLYQVHRTTMGRRIAGLRAQLFEQSREDIKARLQISGSEFDSIMKNLLSDFALNLSSVL